MFHSDQKLIRINLFTIRIIFEYVYIQSYEQFVDIQNKFPSIYLYNNKYSLNLKEFLFYLTLRVADVIYMHEHTLRLNILTY